MRFFLTHNSHFGTVILGAITTFFQNFTKITLGVFSHATTFIIESNFTTLKKWKLPYDVREIHFGNSLKILFAKRHADFSIDNKTLECYNAENCWQSYNNQTK